MDFTWIITVVAGLTGLGIIAGWWVKHGRPRYRAVKQFAAQLGQTVLGRPAERDAYDRETSPAIPPIAEQVAGIRTTVEKLVARDERMAALETTVAEHGQRLTAIEAGHQMERTLGHVAQAKTFDAIEAVARKGEKTNEEQA